MPNAASVPIVTRLMCFGQYMASTSLLLSALFDRTVQK
jgi:hypothetical protein